jgi:hypothetical protein
VSKFIGLLIDRIETLSLTRVRCPVRRPAQAFGSMVNTFRQAHLYDGDRPPPSQLFPPAYHRYENPIATHESVFG